jgi:hypothetical protein
MRAEDDILMELVVAPRHKDEKEVYIHAFITWAPDGGGLSAPRLILFIPGYRDPGTLWMRARVGPRPGLDAVKTEEPPRCGYRGVCVNPVAKGKVCASPCN